MFLGAKSSTIQRVFTRNGKSMTISSLFLFSLMFVLFLTVFSFSFSFSFIFLFFPFPSLSPSQIPKKKALLVERSRPPTSQTQTSGTSDFSLSRPSGVISTLRNLRPSHMLRCEVVSFTRSRSCFASATLHLIQSLSLSPVHPDQHSCI